VAALAGVELPQYLGKVAAEKKNGDHSEKTEA
jgi:hypothetical protein